MFGIYIKRSAIIVAVALAMYSCAPELTTKTLDDSTPESYFGSTDTSNTAQADWRTFFDDPYLVALIDTALKNNQELNIIMQEIEVSQNEVQARKGEYLPFVDLAAGVGLEKTARYTSKGANDANTEIRPGEEMPEPLPDFMVGAFASWEVDIWKKLRNAKKAAVMRYLSTVEGRNFMVTNLIAEIANSYYELLALDNQLKILRQNIDIQSNALEIVKIQKQAAHATELAVRRFEAQVMYTRSLEFGIRQQIVEVENRINFLVGRFPEPIARDPESFHALPPNAVLAGVPSQLLENRPDIRQAEFELEAARLDVKVAKARFYPSLGINAGIGFQAFSAGMLFTTPESLLFGLAGDLAAPLLNRNEIKATYKSANSKQIQAIYTYEQTLLKAFMEVANNVSKIENLENTYNLKSQQVDALQESISISNSLFRSARADYMEVLLTQREALEARFELVENKKMQLTTAVNLYKSLGGGWR